MKISNSNNYIIFKPVNYEFPNLISNDKGVDYYDLNWLKIEFKYYKDDNEVTEYDNCILTFEINNLLAESRKLISKVKGKVESPFLEPLFEISVAKNNNVYNLYVKYVYEATETSGWKYIEIIKCLDKFGFENFFNEIENEFSKFPIR